MSEVPSYWELVDRAVALGIELPTPQPDRDTLADIVAKAEAEAGDDTSHHRVQTTEIAGDDDPRAGTIDDPRVVDPYAHLRKREDATDDEG